MKYMNIEIASAIVTSLIISMVMYYLNRNNKEQITLKTHIKTFAINSLIIVGLLNIKKHVLDKQSIGVMNGGNIDPPVISPVEYNDISVGNPNF